MNRITLIIGCTALAAMLASSAFAGEAAAAAAAPPAPAAAPAAAGKAAATVKSVDGTVETRPAAGQPWVPVKVGDRLSEGADLRTGFRAHCLLEMTQSAVKVDPLTVVRIGELRSDGSTVRTRLYLKQGNLESDVSKTGQKNDFAIVTPAATLSVRGTTGIEVSYFPAFGDSAKPFFTWIRQQFESKAIDQKAFEALEQWANLRWHTGTTIPVGLDGSGGGPLNGALGGGPGNGDNGSGNNGGGSPGGEPFPIYDPGEGGYGAPARTGGSPAAAPTHTGKHGRGK